VSEGSHAKSAGPRLVAFDLDGTLVDSLRDLTESANELLIECGAKPLSMPELGRMVGEGAAVLVARAFAKAGLAQPPEALSRFLAIYNARLLRWTRVYAGMPAVLDELASRVALAVLTNKPLGPTHQILEGLNLAGYFAVVIGGDGPFPRKPDPSGLLHMCETTGVSPRETLLVGDSLIDRLTARAAGTRLCLAGYGFGFDSIPVSELNQDEPTIQSPSELLEFL
jgi:phosphoglycolate phosphatase